MQHVNSRDGHTIAVSESKSIGRIARRSVLSDHALSVLVPILEDILQWDSMRIREWRTSGKPKLSPPGASGMARRFAAQDVWSLGPSALDSTSGWKNWQDRSGGDPT